MITFNCSEIIFDIEKTIIYNGNSLLKKQFYLNSQPSHTSSIALQAEAPSALDDVNGMLLLLVISLLTFTTVSISPSVEIIGINTLLGILSLLIILPILISGIINLILIIS